jgi:hypothetical protein
MDDDNVDTALGFMFDAEREKVRSKVEIEGSVFELAAIDDLPGSYQSGQYLWPAAETLARRLLTDADWVGMLPAPTSMNPAADTDTPQPFTVVELGSGVGLGGLAAATRKEVGRVVMTDYDPGALDLIRDNVAHNSAVTGSDRCSAVLCEWGVRSPYIPQSPLVVGSDLIYAPEVVQPLLTSVDHCLSANGTFVLVSSFDIGTESNALFAKAARELGLVVEEVVGLDYPRVHRVQHLKRAGAV